jgi:hypothetical protein
MLTELHQDLGKQKNALSLEQARSYVSNWHRFVKNLYKGQDKHMPHGIFIPMIDLQELVNLQKTIKHIYINGEKTRIYIVGVRAYYCLKSEVLTAIPVSSTDYPVEAVLVAVYQTNEKNDRVPGSPEEYHHRKECDTHDLIIPVPSVKDIDEPGDGGDSSIYDITQPCPILCDMESPLY